MELVTLHNMFSRIAIFILFVGIILFLNINGFAEEINNSDVKDIELTLKHILFLLIICGSVGGFLHGIVRNNNKLEFPKCVRAKDKRLEVELGCLGDICVGAGGAVAIFLVLVGTININNKPESLLRLVALGILSGFAGGTLLRGLSEKLIKQVGDKVEEGLTATREEIKKTRTFIDAENEFNRGYAFYEAKNYDLALSTLENVLQIEPDYYRAHCYIALTKRRLGAIGEAIKFLDKAIAIKASYALAYYNRSCYKCLVKSPIEDILSDLKKAIEINSRYADSAKKDPDFSEIRNNEEFKKIIGNL